MRGLFWEEMLNILENVGVLEYEKNTGKYFLNKNFMKVELKSK